MREGAAPDELLALSEEYFVLANETVFAAESYSNRQTGRLLALMILMAAIVIPICVLVLTTYLRRVLRIESTNQKLISKVYSDSLTGSPTLEKFQMDSQHFLEQKTMDKFAVFNIDIDNFKYYNDVFGRQYGDEILQNYVNLLRDSIQKDEFFCRVSSDNFLVLRQYTDKQELLFRQQSVDTQIADYVCKTKEQHLFTLCCGICCTEDLVEQLDIAGIIERANFARKIVKKQSVVQYVFYDESIRGKMLSEKDLENRMHIALEHKEFMVYLQPKVDLITGKISCAEALVRWMIPGERMVPPDEFIPVFEKNLFISSLDQYVMDKVCCWMRERLDEGLLVVPVSVNVSRMQLYDPDFVKNYTEIREHYKIPQGMIEIEFTESVVFENITVLLHIVDLLKQNGFRCSLDDFGKGYSSLNLLQNIPIDVLKLDQLFFDQGSQREKAHTIISGIVSMVKQLNITIVAEGVEDMEEVQFLREIGCDLVQGYVFYRPMPIEEFELIINDISMMKK